MKPDGGLRDQWVAVWQPCIHPRSVGVTDKHSTTPLDLGSGSVFVSALFAVSQAPVERPCHKGLPSGAPRDAPATRVRVSNRGGREEEFERQTVEPGPSVERYEPVDSHVSQGKRTAGCRCPKTSILVV